MGEFLLGGVIFFVHYTKVSAGIYNLGGEFRARSNITSIL